MNKNYRLCFGVFLLMSIVPLAASAHATPVEYSPEASTLITISPQEVTIRFSERVEQSASSVNVFGPEGDRINGTSGMVSSADAHVYVQPIVPTKKGGHAVSWQVVSVDDGHFTKGAYIFFWASTTQALGTMVLPPSFSITHSSGYAEAVTIMLKLLGEAMFLGLFALLFVLGQRGALRTEVQPTTLKFARIFFFAAGATLLCGALSYIALKSSALALVQESTWLHALWGFSQTTAGTLSWVLVILLPCFGVIAFPLLSQFSVGARISPRLLLALIVFVVMSYTQARLSHAAASDILPGFSIAINLLHLFGKGLWIGALMALCFVFLPAFARSKETTGAYRALYGGLARLIAPALLLGAVTGAWIVWIHLKDMGNLMTSNWGHIFLLLVFFAAILFVLRVISYAFFERMLSRCVACMHSYAFLEVLIGLIVTFFSALVIITTPPLLHGAAWKIESHDHGITMTLEDDRTQAEALLLTVADEEGRLIDGTPVVTMQNQKAGIGPIVAPAVKRFPGGFVIDGEMFAPQGEWTLAVSLQREGAYDANGNFAFTYPEALNHYRSAHRGRSVGTFELLLMGFVVLVLLTTLFFSVHNKQRERLPRISGDEIAPLSGNYRNTFLVAFAAFVLFAVSGIVANRFLFTSSFEQLCKEHGGMWHQSVPMLSGRALSALAQNGCMLGAGEGMSHFVDLRAFEYYLRGSEPRAALYLIPELPKAELPSVLQFRMEENNLPLHEMTIAHERLLHTIIVSEDFTHFAHIHVEDRGPITQVMRQTGLYSMPYIFPRAGKYIVALNYAVRSQDKHAQFIVGVNSGVPPTLLPVDFSTTKTIEGYTVKLDVAQLPDAPTHIPSSHHHEGMDMSHEGGDVSLSLRYHFEKEGKPVFDLTPYLGAPMHIAVIKDDLLVFEHTHATIPLSMFEQLSANVRGLISGIKAGGHSMHSMSLPARFGPELLAVTSPLSSGTYHIFGEFMRGKEHVVTHFTVEVP